MVVRQVNETARDERSCHRRGISVLEFIGCFSAMIGGVILGSLYLGVDMRDLAAGVWNRGGFFAAY